MCCNSQLHIFCLSLDQKFLFSSAACFLNDRLFLIPSSLTFRIVQDPIAATDIVYLEVEYWADSESCLPPHLPMPQPLFLIGFSNCKERERHHVKRQLFMNGSGGLWKLADFHELQSEGYKFRVEHKPH